MATYRERLTAPASWWIGALVFGAVCAWLVAVSIGIIAAVIAGLLAAAVAAALVAAYGNVQVQAGPDGLRVGDAHLTREFIGEITVLDGAAFRQLLGADADARAFMRTRSYVPGGVRVDVDDPNDRVPYWLISCRHPDAVAAALEWNA